MERGLLWVKGKPGTGKSTLMAFLYQALQAVPAHELHINLEFFFHGRGTTLQKTPIGMFRSLLHQLFTKTDSVRGPIRKAFQEKKVFGEPGKGWEWQLKELQDLFFNGVTDVAKIQAITLFVDALDEAGSEVAEELVAYFHSLNDRLISSNGAARICISCRHYPVVALIPGLEIYVENENYKDISTFVHEQLNLRFLAWEKDSTSINACRALEDAIVKKASGVFQWASLIVPMVARWFNDGESLEKIHQMLARVPKELGAVYEHILENVIEARNRERTLHLMQWICLAERPLSVTELRFALASDDAYVQPSQLCCKDAKDFVETDATMEKLITSLSGGLAEVKHQLHGNNVQFIHQSVNDFLLSNGLNFLVSVSVNALGQGSTPLMSLSSNEIIGRSQHRLSRSCINYLKLEEVLREYINTDSRVEYKQIQSFRQKLPFMDYTTKSWFLHAEKAEGCGISQQELVQQFKPPRVFKTWVKTYKMLHRYSNTYDNKYPEYGSTLLHIACSSNLQSAVRLLLQQGGSVEEEDSSGNRALHYAARCGHIDLTNMLLDAHAEIGVKNKAGSTPLVQAAGNGHEEIVKLFLRRGANINEQTGDSGNALQAATLNGSTILVQMLLECGAEVNSHGGLYGNALQAAAYRGSEAVVQLLLDKGAKVNAQSGYYGNALQAAAYGTSEAIIQLLLDHGAEVNMQGGRYGNALQAAAYGTSEAIVQLLLDHGAEVNAQSGYYGNALQAAAYGGNQAIVQLLLDHGAEVNAQGGRYGSALQAAAYRGHREIVKAIIDEKPEINTEDSLGRLGLYFAIRGNQEDMIEYMLAIGARADSTHTDQQGCSAIHFASSGGSLKALNLVISSGADVNAPDTNGWTPLHWACRNGSERAVQLLIASGATLQSTDMQGLTPIDVAVICNNSQLLPILSQSNNESFGADGNHNVPASGVRHLAICDSCFYVSHVFILNNLRQLIKYLDYIWNSS
jgi:ankyrin repeat domain-containing protein 50